MYLFKAFPIAMQRASGIALAPPRTARKNSARVALVNINEPTGSLLSDCFRQFGIEAVVMSGGLPTRLEKEKFEACVLHMDREAEPVMDAARRSPSNSRMVIYGLGGSAQEAMRFAQPRQLGERAPAQEPEVAGVARNRHAAELFDHLGGARGDLHEAARARVRGLIPEAGLGIDHRRDQIGSGVRRI